MGCAGSAGAPRHQLRADLEVLLIEGCAGIKVLTVWVTIQPKAGDQVGEVSGGRVSSWLLEAPLSFEGAEQVNSCGCCAMLQGFLGVG